ncbi:ribosome biogenesis GTPase YlqF [Acaryochloris sp. IP29b_bin.137]|uniref:ribosome biogenesis GTPase YlqF n=1 Tax=Acaryochloris sp. IP29b_bin.137 TaxID=2969217 RepID=UPI002609635C|nr:ribosome biogenesis GTPase YlqF [Acaryochloris sp. IP29b_bin.137]
MSTPPIQWYPGHIAKAEKALVEQLKKVDVVLEVRDARIPRSSHHPQTQQWVGDKPHVLVLNRIDLVTPVSHQLWLDALKAEGQVPYCTDAQHGKGIKAVIKAAEKVGVSINQRRRDRGMRPRPVRAVVLGFPNVGKSALINRLLKRRMVESARRPGVTRQLRWVRVSQDLDLLDTPGVLPAKLNDQEAAYKLAICDDIGTAAYDNQLVAIALINLLQQLSNCERPSGFIPDDILATRYQLNPAAITAEDYLAKAALQKHQGNLERMAHHILTDFRKGSLGKITLELPHVCEVSSQDRKHRNPSG